jgi:hypothetical protein
MLADGRHPLGAALGYNGPAALISVIMSMTHGFAGKLAGGLGFEPRQAESESAVLPLDDPPMISKACVSASEPEASSAAAPSKRGF